MSKRALSHYGLQEEAGERAVRDGSPSIYSLRRYILPHDICDLETSLIRLVAPQIVGKAAHPPGLGAIFQQNPSAS
jgi:hypothetical protein